MMNTIATERLVIHIEVAVALIASSEPWWRLQSELRHDAHIRSEILRRVPEVDVLIRQITCASTTTRIKHANSHRSFALAHVYTSVNRVNPPLVANFVAPEI